MKQIKKLILLTLIFSTVYPGFSQTAQDWQNVLKLVPEKIEENKRRIEAAKKAEQDRIAAERKAEQDRIAAERKAEQDRIAAERKAWVDRIAAEREAKLKVYRKDNTRYVESMDSYFVKIPVSRAYEVMTTEVTQKLWKLVMGKNPSQYYIGEKYPVNNVSWIDCVIFCNKLSEKEGLTPCYSYNGTTDVSKWKLDSKKIEKMKDDKRKAFFEAFDSAMVCNFDASGYRLPTKDEWKSAASHYFIVGTRDNDNIDDVAWYRDNSKFEAHEVATKKSNDYGLYDMYGNVEEWCWNKEEEKRYGKPDYGVRFICGGDYCDDKSQLIKADWSESYLYNAWPTKGLRLVRTVE